jgi:hypothetical protein
VHATGLLVCSLARDRICTMTPFDNRALARYKLSSIITNQTNRTMPRPCTGVKSVG